MKEHLLAAASEAGQRMWGVWSLSSKAVWGSQAGKVGFLPMGPEPGASFTFLPGPSVDCPPPGAWPQGHSPGGFKMASVRLPLREEEKGREGAVAQPPGLFCVGRLPLPVSAVSAATAAVSGCRHAEMPVAATRWAWGGCFRPATSQCSAWGLLPAPP